MTSIKKRGGGGVEWGYYVIGGCNLLPVCDIYKGRRGERPATKSGWDEEEEEEDICKS